MAAQSIQVVAVDNGNYLTKCLDGLIQYQSGYQESKIKFVDENNMLYYDGRYFSIGTERFPVQMDKSIDEQTFILTLPAIANSLCIRGVNNADIIIAGGLPISNYGDLRERFKKYFIRDNIQFDYNGAGYSVNIIDAHIYPQGVSAVYMDYHTYKGLNEAFIVDVGGFTCDFCLVENGLLKNMKHAFSFQHGVITLINELVQEIAKKGINLSASQVEQGIKGDHPLFVTDEIKSLITEKTMKFTNDLIAMIRERGIETKVIPVFFVGGGSLLLRKYIEVNSSQNLNYFEFRDQFANVRGYDILARQQLKKEGAFNV